MKVSVKEFEKLCIEKQFLKESYDSAIKLCENYYKQLQAEIKENEILKKSIKSLEHILKKYEKANKNKGDKK